MLEVADHIAELFIASLEGYSRYRMELYLICSCLQEEAVCTHLISGPYSGNVKLPEGFRWGSSAKPSSGSCDSICKAQDTCWIWRLLRGLS